MYRSILVPLDGSSFGEHALPLAARIARKAGAELRLLHVHTQDAEIELPTLTPYQFEGLSARYMDDRISAEEGEYLAEISRRLSAEGPVSLSTEILGGGLAAALERYVCESDADLLVMTTHARGTLARLWMGGCANTLVRRGRKPVILIHAHEGEHETQVWQQAPIERILVSLDGSPVSEQVLGAAIDLARLLGSAVELFTVVTPAMAVAGAFGRPGGAGAGAAMQAAQEYLAALAARIGGIETEPQVAAGTDAATAILEAADLRGAGLIAMATHGRGGVSRLVTGSVAEKVVRGTRRPVLLVRPHGAH